MWLSLGSTHPIVNANASPKKENNRQTKTPYELDMSFLVTYPPTSSSSSFAESTALVSILRRQPPFVSLSNPWPCPLIGQEKMHQCGSIRFDFDSMGSNQTHRARITEQTLWATRWKARPPRCSVWLLAHFSRTRHTGALSFPFPCNRTRFVDGPHTPHVWGCGLGRRAIDAQITWSHNSVRSITSSSKPSFPRPSPARAAEGHL